MKQLPALAFLLLVIVLTTCGQQKPNYLENELTINREDVNQVFISGYCAPLDTCIKSTYRLYLLDDTMTGNLIRKLNKSTSKDPSGYNVYSSAYQLYIDLRDGTTRNFNMLEESIMEDNEGCFEIDDPNYFKNLWSTLDKAWMEMNKSN